MGWGKGEEGRDGTRNHRGMVDLNIRFVHVHRLDLSSARIAWLL